MNTAIAPVEIAEKPWTFALGVGIVRNAGRIWMQRINLTHTPTYLSLFSGMKCVAGWHFQVLKYMRCPNARYYHILPKTGLW